jgi:pimeloyl-ACP methyl ester carboxylesterase
MRGLVSGLCSFVTCRSRIRCLLTRCHLSCSRTDGSEELLELYRRLKCPTTIIAGRDDEIVESEQAVRLQKTMPHATVTLVPQAGHMVHYFVADQIVRIADVAQLEAAA